jgi:hypothetical protein
MPKVTMPRGDWDTVIMVMTMARDYEIVGYIDDIIDDIDNQIAKQEY